MKNIAYRNAPLDKSTYELIGCQKSHLPKTGFQVFCPKTLTLTRLENYQSAFRPPKNQHNQCYHQSPDIRYLIGKLRTLPISVLWFIHRLITPAHTEYRASSGQLKKSRLPDHLQLGGPEFLSLARFFPAWVPDIPKKINNS